MDWIKQLRYYIGTGIQYQQYFDNAIECCSKKEIKDHLMVFHSLEKQEQIIQSLQLYKKLKNKKQTKEANIVFVLSGLPLYHYIESPDFLEKKIVDGLINQASPIVDITVREGFSECTAVILAIIASKYAKIKSLNLAKKNYQEALEISRKIAEKEPHIYRPNIATILNSLGNVQRDNREYVKAEQSYQEALEITRELAVEEPHIYRPNIAGTLNNLGNLQINNREYVKAEQSFQEALEIRRELAVEEPHIYRPDLAMTLNNLGNVQRNNREYIKAEKSYLEAISITENIITNNNQIQEGERADLKGSIQASYQFLMEQEVKNNNPKKALCYFSSLHNADFLSLVDDIDGYTIKLQEELKQIERHTKKTPLLILAHQINQSVIIGWINFEDIGFEEIKMNDWGKLLPSIGNEGNEGSENGDEIASTNDSRQQLFKKTFYQLPKVIQECFINNSPNDQEIIICGDSFFNLFPWELFPCGKNQEDYLGLNYPLPRLSNFSVQELANYNSFEFGEGKEDLVVFAPHDTGNIPLEDIPYEVESIKKHFDSYQWKNQRTYLGTNANTDSWMKVLTSSPSIIYFTGHGAYQGNETSLVMHGKDTLDKIPALFSRYDLENLRASLDKDNKDKLFNNSPLVILNSCWTGLSQSYGGRKEDLISDFIEKGCGGVIASPLPIYARIGVDFGINFFKWDTNIGKTLVKTRKIIAQKYQSVKHPFWGTWAMIHLYGSPYATLKLTNKEEK